MLDFIGDIFKGIFTFIVILALILVAISGIFMLSQSILLAIAVWVGGFILVILSAGLVSIIISMKDYLQFIALKVDSLNSKYSTLQNNSQETNISPVIPKRINNGDNWVCKKCNESNPNTSSNCKGCGAYK